MIMCVCLVLHDGSSASDAAKKKHQTRGLAYSLLYYYNAASDVQFSWQHNYDTAFLGYYKRVPV